MRILIVEDRKEIAAMFAEYLKPLNTPIEIAYDWAQAVAAMRRIPPPDLILLDLVLPDTASAEATLYLIGELRKHNEKVVIVVITGHPDPSLPGLAGSLGADEFITKMQIKSQETLWKVVKDAIDKKCLSDRDKAEGSCDMAERLSELLLARNVA